MDVSYNSQTEEITSSGAFLVPKRCKARNLIGFWILGLCNNYGYVIMLSAAFDLLHTDTCTTKEVVKTNQTERYCNPVSTGAILLADILPSLAIKLIAPFLGFSINFRMFIAIQLSLASFLITSFSISHWMTFAGVICAALSSGLGEVTLLSFSSYFDKDVVSTWSSGTGGAGVVGALSYASLTHALNVCETLQVMAIMPILMSIIYCFVIEHPPVTNFNWKCNCNSELSDVLEPASDHEKDSEFVPYRYRSLGEKISLIRPLLKYMIPLGIVYFAEYFINQGLMELLYFPDITSWITHKEQYRWYQVDYQIGVFLSRSSVNLFQVRRLWILPFLQVLNLIFLFCEAYYQFLPSIWIVFAIILYEGLLGGCAYVNTFYSISKEVPEEHKEFSMGVASLADSTGIALAGALALPVHDALCKMH